MQRHGEPSMRGSFGRVIAVRPKVTFFSSVVTVDNIALNPIGAKLERLMDLGYETVVDPNHT